VHLDPVHYFFFYYLSLKKINNTNFLVSFTLSLAKGKMKPAALGLAQRGGVFTPPPLGQTSGGKPPRVRVIIFFLVVCNYLKRIDIKFDPLFY
jgi:hypothetical protein